MKAEAKKIAKLKEMVAVVFEMRKNGVLSQQVLEATTPVLEANIEFSTFWNYRREALLQLMTDASQEEKVILLNGELKVKPRSFSTLTC